MKNILYECAIYTTAFFAAASIFLLYAAYFTVGTICNAMFR